jgi:hypothetical protein
MTRKAIIFGNGLGMALDPIYFKLQSAMNSAWTNKHWLDDAQRNLMKNCLTPKEYPENEDDLDILHLAASSCEFLLKIGTAEANWLTEYGQDFPDAIQRYITSASWYFHDSGKTLPSTFTDPLTSFIKETKSHVATLNYDDLLYDSFVSQSVTDGYDGALVDGFHNDGFQEENMDRKHKNNFGYYLHLHGTPLFVDKDNAVVKQHRSAEIRRPTQHVVLAHVKHKRTVIDASQVLRAYWSRLAIALRESEELLLVGYSGKDLHLNNLIQGYTRSLPIRIIEWDNGENNKERKTYWQQRLNSEDIKVFQMKNILEFTAWETGNGIGT